MFYLFIFLVSVITARGTSNLAYFGVAEQLDGQFVKSVRVEVIAPLVPIHLFDDLDQRTTMIVHETQNSATDDRQKSFRIPRRVVVVFGFPTIYQKCHFWKLFIINSIHKNLHRHRNPNLWSNQIQEKGKNNKSLRVRRKTKNDNIDMKYIWHCNAFYVGTIFHYTNQIYTYEKW